jgi:NTP pyrophosphatase (non-canonical NTP hydrolase)
MTIFNTDERKETITFLNTLSTVMHNVAVDKGFWEEPKETGTYIALMHSELSEALEADRKNKMDDHLPQRQGIEVELADAVIRIFDFAGAKRLDLGGAIVDKLEYNSTRPYKHGKEY